MPMSEEVRRRLLGTSADSRAPWETWDEAMDPMKNVSPGMKLAIENYSRKHHNYTSSENLEQLCRQKEMSNEMVREYQFYRQKEDDLADLQGFRKGRVLHCLYFLDQLNKIIPAYLSSNIQKGLTGLAVYKPKEYVENGQNKIQYWQYVCGVQAGYMHEYSTLHFDRHGLPLNEKWRGWRTVLLRLILKGFVTEKQALEFFGEAKGPASRRYLEQLYCFRNRVEKVDSAADQTGRVQ